MLCQKWFATDLYFKRRQRNYTMDFYKRLFYNRYFGFYVRKPSRWNMQALVDTEIYTIKRSDYNKIESIEPKWFDFEKMFIIKCFEMVENRVFSHLSMTAEERYNAYFDMNNEIFNQVPLQYIASLLGMTPETLSRIRKKQLEL